MKAYFVRSPYGVDALEIGDKPMPLLLPKQVLVQVKAVALNYRDRLVINGIGSWKAPDGRIPASDGMGVIVNKGADADRFEIGNRVVIAFFPKWMDGKISPEKLVNPLGGAVRDGTLQEFIAVDESELVSVPAYLTDEEAATLPCAALTAWNGMFVNGKVKKGDFVLIEGTGGVSLFSLQFALTVGAIPIVISGSDEKLEKVTQMGAGHLINYIKTPRWENEVLEITGGKGVDHVVEVIGGSNINRAVKVAAPECTISVIGLIDGMSSEIEISPLMFKQVRLQGIEVGSKQMLTAMTAFLDKHKVKPVIDAVYSFDEAKTAFRRLEEGKHFGKICIVI